MKKFTAIALVTALICGMAGCNSKKEEGKTGGDVPVLKMHMPFNQQNDLAMVVEKANEIIEPAIGAKLEMVFIDTGSYSEKMNMKLATKEDFDICFTSSWLNDYSKGVKNKSYYPLTELISEYAPELWDAIPEYWFEATKKDGEIYAVPNQQIAATIPALTMDKKWADKYNFDYTKVKSPKDIEPFLEEIRVNEPDVYPMRGAVAGYYTQNTYEGIASGVGLDRTNTGELKAIYAWDAKGYEDDLRLARDWYEKGYIRSDIASVMDDTNDFFGGKYVVTTTGWKPGFEAAQAGNLGGEHIAMKLADKSYITKSGLLATMHAISAYSKNPDKAIKLLALIQTNKELYNLLAHGIEGVHYTKVDDKHIKLNEESGYYLNMSWAFGNQFNAYPLEGQEENVWEETKKMNDEGERSRLLSFSFDSQNVQTQLSQLATIQQQYVNMNNGSTDWEKVIEEYKIKMKNAGVEDVLKEVQKQLDEYAKTLD